MVNGVVGELIYVCTVNSLLRITFGYKVSNTRANILLNLLNELKKSDACETRRLAFYCFFCNEFNEFNTTIVRIIYSNHHMP